MPSARFSAQARALPVDSLATTGRPQEIVLVGASLAHLEFLAQLRTHALPQARVTLLGIDPYLLPHERLSELVSGRAELADCQIGLEALAGACGARWRQGRVAQLHVPAQTITLTDGTTLRFDWLSLSPRCWDNRERIGRNIPGALDHSLFTRPVERFMALWPRVLDLHAQRTLRITVLGGGTQGAELAFAIRQRLPQAALTWLTLGVAPAAEDLENRALEQVLQASDITVLHDRARAIAQGSVHLACGATLASDVPIMAEALDAPAWLRDSGLLPPEPADAATALPAERVDAWSRCTGHPQVFLAPEADTALGHNLAASVLGTPLRTTPGHANNGLRWFWRTPGSALHWPPLPLRGIFGNWAKSVHDRRLHARYQIPAEQPPTQDAPPPAAPKPPSVVADTRHGDAR